MKTTTKIILAYIIGQATQLVIHGFELSVSMWDSRQIPVCLAAGFLVLVAMMIGVYISNSENKKPESKHEKKTSDWEAIELNE